MPKGPAANFARDARRSVVNGLLVQKSATKTGVAIDRYYALNAQGKRKYFGNSLNLPEAVRRFRKWKAQTDHQRVILSSPIDLDHLEEFVDRFAPGEEFRITINPDGSTVDETTVSSDAFWDKVGEEIRANPKLAAQKTGIEELAYLDRLTPPTPSATLQALGKLYQDDKKASLTRDEWRNSKVWWDEFIDITQAKRVRDLDRESFRKYRNTILERMREKKRSNAWTRSRFGKVKTIINHALSEMNIDKDDRAALALRSLLKQPPKPAPNPVDITPMEFGKTLRKATAWEKALYLTALNCAYYPIDCTRLRWSMIDSGRGTIRFDREKATGLAKGAVPRVAVLWKRTIEALNKLPRLGEHVFALPPRKSKKKAKSKPRDSVNPETLSRHFVAARDRAGITRNLTFENIRDSALTAAAESTDPVVPIQQYHVLAGHVAKGVDDSYISRHPRFVETACRAIEARYFNSRN